MSWTKKTPTEDGYYWWRPLPTYYALIVHVVGGRVTDAPARLLTRPVASMGGEWCGPLTEPPGHAEDPETPSPRVRIAE